MQRPATAWLCLLGLLTVSTAALAEDEDYARQGFYAGVLGLGAIETFDVSGRRSMSAASTRQMAAASTFVLATAYTSASHSKRNSST